MLNVGFFFKQTERKVGVPERRIHTGIPPHGRGFGGVGSGFRAGATGF